MKTIKVGINGWGRIGRQVFRLSQSFPSKKPIEVVAINSPGPIDMALYLLKYDSVHGPFSYPIKSKKNQLLLKNGKGKNSTIHYSSHAHPKDIPWDTWGVDVVFECSGVFKKRTDLDAHFKKGVKKVLLAYPCEAADFTLVYGVNHKHYRPRSHHVISLASCTTNCLAPLIALLDRAFQIKTLHFTTVHSYTSDQSLLDSSHRSSRRGRAAPLSIIPTHTGASLSLGKIFPHLKQNIKGQALRVPTPNGSLCSMVFLTKKKVQPKDINSCIIKAKSDHVLKSVVGTSSEELVSSDYNGSTHSAVLDLNHTESTQNGLHSILAWYDNECGFSQRMLDVADHML